MADTTSAATSVDVQETADVIKLLAEIKKLNSASIAQAETERVAMDEPEPEFLHPYEPDFIEGYELRLPSGHQITVKHIIDAYVAGENIHFYGKSGCGKSSLAYHLVDLVNKPIRDKNKAIFEENLKRKKADGEDAKLEEYIQMPYRISPVSCHRQLRSENLIGTLKFKVDEQGNKVWFVVKGAVTEAWTEGRTLIIEEMDMAQPDVWAECHQFFDGRTKVATVYVNGPMIIRKADRFRLIATSNTRGRGEDEMNFAGTQPQNTAFLNRFTYAIQVPWLNADAECDLLIRKAQITSDQAKKMVEVAKEIRESEDEGCILHTISTRDLMSWARECKREEKRSGQPPDLAEWWGRIAVRSAYPTFLARIEDENTLETMTRYIKVS